MKNKNHLTGHSSKGGTMDRWDTHYYGIYIEADESGIYLVSDRHDELKCNVLPSRADIDEFREDCLTEVFY